MLRAVKLKFLNRNVWYLYIEKFTYAEPPAGLGYNKSSPDDSDSEDSIDNDEKPSPLFRIK